MQRTLLMVDTAHASHATRLAAMQAANQALVSYTLTDTVLPLPAGDADVADYSLIDCLVPNASRTGDIAWAHRDNMGDDYFIMELTGEDIPLMAPDLLGRTSRNIRFVRTATGTGSSPGAGYGKGTGKTWGDAFDGFEDTANIGATWATGTTYWICGFIVGYQKPTGGFVYTLDPDFQDAGSTPTEHRMDYSLDPGMQALFSVDTRGTNNAFSRPDAVNHPRVWNSTWNVASLNGRWWLTPIDPTLSTTDIYTNHVFKTVSSQTEVENTPLSRWVNGSDLWVHMPDDTDPNDRIGGGNPDGYQPQQTYMDGVSAKTGLRYIMCQYIGNYNSANMGTGQIFPQAEFLGGRCIHGASFKPQQKCEPGTKWGECTRGTVGWDTSDRPDPETDAYIAKAVAKGSDQNRWNRINFWLEIDSAEEGIYWFGTGLTPTISDDGVVDGLLTRYIGTAHPVLLAKFGTALYDDGDAHALATQGGSNWDIGFWYCQEAGSAFNWYAITDATTAQNIQNNILHDFVIRDGNHKYISPGAGENGVFFNGDGQVYARQDGSGNYAGNIIRRGCIANIIGDPSGTKFGSPAIIAGGFAIGNHYPELLTVEFVHVVNCTHAIAGQRNVDAALGESGPSDATTPATGALIDGQIKVHNCTFEEIVERIIYSRNTKWDLARVTISSITKANPAVVTTSTAHGFPDIAQPDVYIEPEVYFAEMAGMTELDGNVYKAVWISTTQFSLKTLAGANVDSTAFGTFTSGKCARANIGYYDLQNNTIILKSGETASTDKYRYDNGNQTLAELQARVRLDLPGADSEVLESGTSIAA